MPRSSVSVGVVVGGDDGTVGVPGRDCKPGTPGKENCSLAGGNGGAEGVVASAVAGSVVIDFSL
jgi:hypothetical protein